MAVGMDAGRLAKGPGIISAPKPGPWTARLAGEALGKPDGKTVGNEEGNLEGVLMGRLDEIPEGRVVGVPNRAPAGRGPGPRGMAKVRVGTRMRERASWYFIVIEVW